jgi:Tfp pilus assembly protein PilF
MSVDANAKALELFEKAVAADPRLARAWADLAYTRQNSIN